MSDSNFSASQLAIIAAIVTVIGDILGLAAAVSAAKEEKESSDNNRRKLEDICKYIKDKLES